MSKRIGLCHRKWRMRAKYRGATIQEQSQLLAERRAVIEAQVHRIAYLELALADKHPGIFRRVWRWLWGAR